MSADIDYYFAYGSNMNLTRVQHRQMGFTETFAGQLKNYRLVFNKRSLKYPGAGAANVVRSQGQVAEGIIYRLSDPRQIEVMDPFEGYPKHYDREHLLVETAKGKCRAWVYLANPEYVDEDLKPAKWYLNHLLAGRAFLSEGYVQSLSRTSCLRDSDVETDD